ncbi:RND family efflux transporter MFP subunit [Neorhizobium galegae]|uniref:efflux RND transporter periplasmic adaptor subunit n=1 Tax=Neorhizobium galegae TaxID=399 RepID=UPI001AEB3FDD|nr:efflux RND transporter periplasmic adaptor subunit [Neorhizobium galegae]MBP2562487.1 RND family efflux transporter MFP subunit [Neorhizobium galegae]
MIDTNRKSNTCNKPGPRSSKISSALLIASSALIGGIALSLHMAPQETEAAPVPQPVEVTVSPPIELDINKRLTLLGQFSPSREVEIRAQVGGILTQIGFKDGEIVQKGSLLFQIDPTPYEIRFSEATAALGLARTRLELANIELTRASALQRAGGGTTQNADQRAAEQRSAQAAFDSAEAGIRDAQFDLDRTRIAAPFTGRIGTHLVSEGNLIAGSRASTNGTTLLARIVSTDKLFLNFDMSENDYLAFQRERRKQTGSLVGKVKFALADEEGLEHVGMLDFVDNVLDRSSGTIHARATVDNPDGLLTPGGFARLRLAVSQVAPALLVPDSAVMPDQSEHVVWTVDKDNVVRSRRVDIGDMWEGLRVIRSGLEPSDNVVIDGLPTIRTGSVVTPRSKQVPHVFE